MEKRIGRRQLNRPDQTELMTFWAINTESGHRWPTRDVSADYDLRLSNSDTRRSERDFFLRADAPS